MSRWPLVPLGEVCEIIAGQSPPGESYNTSGEGLPFFQGKAEFGDLHPVPAKWCTAPTKIALEGDILISVRAPVGPTNVAPIRCCIGRGLAAIRPKRGKVEPDYLLHYLRHVEPDICRRGQGSTFGAITRKELTDLSLPIPPLSEQRRIVDILNRANGIRRLRRAVSERARQIAPALFMDMFGEPSLGSTTLGELIRDGPQNGLYRPASDYGEGVPILRINSFYGGSVTGLDELRRVQLDEATVRKYQLHEDDIVVNRVNSRPFLGKSAIIPALLEPLVFESNMMRFSVKKDLVLPTYVIAALQTDEVRRQLLSRAKDAINQSSINQDDVRSVRLKLPPLEVQRRFASRITEIQGILAQTETAVATANLLGASLMAHLFDD